MIFSRDVKTTGLLFLLSLALFASNGSARICHIDPDNDHGHVTASNQTQLDALFEGCTSIVGFIIIDVDYKGSFSLPHIESISDGIMSAGEVTGVVTKSLTSIDAESLTTIGYLSIANTPMLTNISFPNLYNFTTGIGFEGVGDSASLDFRSLEFIPGDLVLSGHLGTINFPILAGVGGILRVTSNKDYNPSDRTQRKEDYNSYPPLDVDFPMLHNASSVVITGNISSLNMPRLSIITAHRDVDADHGVFILPTNHPLNISLPSLSESSFIDLKGRIGSFSFPKLLSTNYFEIDAYDGLSVKLSPLTTITEDLTLLKNITEISLSSLEHVRKINITSSAKALDCAPAITAYERDGSKVPKDNGDSEWFHCGITDAAPPPKRGPLSRAAIIGMAVGIPAFVILLALFIYAIKRKRATQKPTEQPPPYAMEALPKYTPREDRGSSRGADSVQDSEGVASTHPLDRRNNV